MKTYEARDKVLLVGANDGMLHAFHAGTWRTTLNHGRGDYDAGTGKAAGSFDAPGDLKGPIHVVRGIVAFDFLILAVTGEGQLVAIRPQSLQPEGFAWSPLTYFVTGFPIWR